MNNEVNELYKLNPAFLTSKKKCIFGTGMHARQTYVELYQNGIAVDFFSDHDIRDKNASYMGIPLIGEEKLKEINVSVIIASTAWKDIAKRLYQQGITDIFVDRRRYGEVDVQENYLCSVGKYAMNRKTTYILCPAGIGDTLYVAAFAKKVKECNLKISKICLITKESHACIGNFFEEVDEVIASDQLVEQLDLYSIATKTWYLNNYIYGHIKKNLCQTFDNEYVENKGLSILSYYKKVILKIPDESEPDFFHYKLEDNKRKIVEIIGENKRFVILIPYANTAKMLSMEFWEKCADLFINDDYYVYTNVKNSAEQAIPGTLPICEDIDKMVSICSQASLVVSVRNGMCDVLAMGKAHLMILDTDKEFYEKWSTNQFNQNSVHIKCFDQREEEILKEIICQYRLNREKGSLKHGVHHCTGGRKGNTPWISDKK